MKERSNIMVASVLKGVTAYLSSLNARSAVYSEELELVWSSCDEFFRSFDTELIREALPVKSEKPVPVQVGDVKYAMDIVPLYRSKRLVYGYACVLRNSYEVFRLVNSSPVSEHIELFLRETQEKSTRIIGASKMMEGLVPECENREKLLQYIREQSMQASRIYTEAFSTGIVSFVKDEEKKMESEEAPAVNCNVSALITVLCNEAAQCLVKTKRKLIKNIDGRSYYAKVDYRVLAVAFMSMFRSHLYISPAKSGVEVTAKLEGGAYVITVKTELLPYERTELQQEQKSLQDRELARRIIASECDGSLAFTSDKSTAVSEIRIPVVKKNRGASLNLVNSEYLTGNYKPVHPFIDEITQREEQLLTAEKEPGSAQAKKNVQKRKKK